MKTMRKIEKQFLDILCLNKLFFLKRGEHETMVKRRASSFYFILGILQIAFGTHHDHHDFGTHHDHDNYDIYVNYDNYDTDASFS